MGAQGNWGDGVDRALYDLKVLGDGWLLAEEAAERAMERAINSAREVLAERHEEQRRAATRGDEELLEARAHHYQREAEQRAVAEQREAAEWQARIERAKREQAQLKAEAVLQAKRLAPAPRASRVPLALAFLTLLGSVGSVAYLKADEHAGRERLDWARQSVSELHRFSAAQEVERKRLEALTHDLLAQLNQPKACAPQPAPARPRPRPRSAPSTVGAAAEATSATPAPPTKAAEAPRTIREDPNDPIGLSLLGL
jgi:hypothetical protein